MGDGDEMLSFLLLDFDLFVAFDFWILIFDLIRFLILISDF